MKIRSIALALTLAVTALAQVGATTASAATVTLSGTVFGGGNELSGASVQVIDGTNTIVVDTTTNASGFYSLSFEEGTYDLRYSGPAGSAFGDALLPDEEILTNTVKDVVLTAGVVSVDGLVVDSNGDPLPFIDDGGAVRSTFNLSGPSNASGTIATATGAYTLDALPGEYFELGFSGTFDTGTATGGIGGTTYQEPGQNITTNTTLPTVNVPVKTIDIAIRDTNGNPTNADVRLTSNTNTNLPGWTSNWGISVNTFTNNSDSTGYITTSGNATLYVTYPGLPEFTQTIDPNTTTITVTPPTSLSVDGLVVDSNGDPLPFIDDGGAVRSTFNLSGPSNASGTIDTATGAYTLDALPGEYFELGFSGTFDTGTATGGIGGTTYQEPGQNITTNTTLPTVNVPVKTIDIAIRDTNGNPTNADVRLTSNTNTNLPGWTSNWGISVNTFTNNSDSTGYITTSGNATLYVTYPGLPEFTQTIDPNTTTITVTPPTSLSVDGLVVDSNGDPLPFIDDGGAVRSTFNLSGPSNASGTIATATGAYTLDALPGEYFELGFSGTFDTGTATGGIGGMTYQEPGQNITTNTTLPTVNVPVKTIDIAIRDTNGNPTNADVRLTSNTNTNLPGWTSNWGISVNTFTNNSDSTGYITTSGNATLYVTYPGLPEFTQTIDPNTTTSITVLKSGTVIPGDPDAENDGDNVNDLVEALGPNGGDANYDGTPDAEQVNVASLPSFNGTGNYVAVAAPTGSSLTNVTTIDPAPLNPPANQVLPDGLNKFLVSVPNPGDSITISIYPHAPATITGYAKYQNDVWTELPSNLVTILPNRVDITLTDGGIGDADGVANGVIDDPGGPSTDATQLHTISGTLTFSDGSSNAGALVQAFRTSDGALAGDAQIDEFGAYSIDVLNGDYELRATNLPAGASDPTIAPTTVTVADGPETLDFEVTISAPPGISGTVYKFGAPLDPSTDYFQVAAENIDTFEYYESSIDPDGTYSIPNLPDGSYRVSVYDMGTGTTAYHPDATNDMDAAIVTLSGGVGATGIDVSFPFGPGTISGTVTASGNPVEFANVTAYDQNYEFRGSASTDASGAYTLIGLQAGDYRVEFHVDGATRWNDGAFEFWEAPAITITEASPTVTGIDADYPGGGFSGTLLEADGSTFDDYVSLSIQQIGGNAYRNTGVDFDTGAFEIRYLAAGDYAFFAQPMDGGNIPLGTFSTDGTTITSGLTLQVAGGSISGTVLDNGGPIDPYVYGYEVQLLDTNGNQIRQSGVDEFGSYSFGFVADGQYVVAAVSYENYVTRYHPDATSFENATVVEIVGGAALGGVDVDFVPPAGVINGTITDATGSPIEGINVSANSDYGFGGGSSAVTGIDGTYSLTGLEPGEYRVDAVTPFGGFFRYRDDNSVPDDDIVVVPTGAPVVDGIDFELPTGGVSGTIDLAGAPSFDAQLRAERDGRTFARTDVFGAGTYELGYLPAGNYDLVVEIDDELTVRLASITSDGQTTITGLALSLPTGSISGTVLQNGAPYTAAGEPAYVSVSDTSGEPVRQQVTVEPDGTFTVSYLPDGDYLVDVRTDGVGGRAWYPAADSPDTASAITIAGGAAVTGADITLPDSGSISGTVTDADGNPVSTQVNLLDSNGDFVGGDYYGSQSSTFTSFDGTFVFSDVEVGDYYVAAYVFDAPTGRAVPVHSPGVTALDDATVITVTPSTSTVADIAVPAPSTISGTVTDANGDPVSDVSIEVTFLNFGSTSGSQIATTGPDGTYTSVEFLAVDPVIGFVPSEASGLSVQYYDQAGSAFAADAVVLTPGADTPGIDASLGQPGTVTGKLTDESGADQPGFVLLYPSSLNEPRSYGSDGIETGPDGSFTFSDVPPGDWVVYAVPIWNSPDTFANTFSGSVMFYDQATTLTVTSGATVNGDLVVQTGGSLIGTVTDPDGNPVAGAQVNNYSTRVLNPGGLDDPFFGSRSTYTDINGNYVLAGLRPGEIVPYFYVPSVSQHFLGEFNAGEYRESDATGITIPGDGTPAVLDSQFERGINGVATFRDDDGVFTPLERNATGDIWQAAFCLSPSQPANDGYSNCSNQNSFSSTSKVGDTFISSGLAAGTYNIAAFSYGDSGRQQTDTITVTVAFGEQITCEFWIPGSSGTSTCAAGPVTLDGTISGTVLGPDGDPQPGVRVSAYDAGSDGAFQSPSGAISGPDGTYTINQLPPGDYRVEFWPEYWGPFGFPSPYEWYTDGPDDVYEQNFLDATTVTVAASGAITGIDVQLDRAIDGVITVPDAPTGVEISVLACPSGYTINTSWYSCDDGPDPDRQEYPRSGYSQTGSPVDLTYLRPGDWNVVARYFDGTNFVNTDTVAVSLPKNTTFTCELYLPGNGTSTCDVTPLDLDDDDGVDETEEDGAPNNGDGNDDGTPDGEQSSVASLADPSIPDPGGTGANYVTVSSTEQSSGSPAALTNVTLVVPPAENPPPMGATPQSSLIGFEVVGLPTGPTPAVAELEIFLPQQADSYYKYDVDTGVWTDATSLATFDPAPTTIGGVERWRVVLTIEDGGFGDDDGLVNGSVSDPGLFALADRDGPDIVCPAAQSYVLRSAGATLTATVFDGRSGVAEPTATVAVDTTTLGAQTVDVTASDLAGNTTTVSCDYTVGAELVSVSHDFDGSTVYVANASRTVPITWQLVDAAGTTVGLDEIAVESLFSWPVPCDGSDPAESDTTALAGDDEVRQLGNGDYRLNWKTQKQWSGTCRTLQIGFTGDLAAHVLDFDFR